MQLFCSFVVTTPNGPYHILSREERQLAETAAVSMNCAYRDDSVNHGDFFDENDVDENDVVVNDYDGDNKHDREPSDGRDGDYEYESSSGGSDGAVVADVVADVVKKDDLSTWSKQLALLIKTFAHEFTVCYADLRRTQRIPDRSMDLFLGPD